MAEVPEVEILVRDLRQAVVGRRIEQVLLPQPVAVRFPAPEEYAALLAGQAVQGARRWAKHIWLPLSKELALEIHLMLWGTLVLVPCERPMVPDTMIVWRLDGGEELRLIDKLGYARSAAGEPDALIARLDLNSLGPDALEPGFDDQVLLERLKPRRGVLKTVLLNQRVLAGLGNRDADESMWLAGIDPRRPASSLSEDEITRLRAAIEQVLREGLALRGTQRDLFGRKGQAPHGRFVFERTGRPCLRCQTPIAGARIGGRNTHYCPRCQQ
jgi:formamidopyrimidine-DNA glycosylase